MKIRVFLVDDHPIFRAGLRQVIELAPDMVVIGEAGDASSALEGITAALPEVAILDLGLPGEDGLALAGRLRQELPQVRLVVLTMAAEEAVFRAALSAGVHGYVLKDNAAFEVLEAVRAAARGAVYVSPSMAGFLARPEGAGAAEARVDPHVARLTFMERRVLRLTADHLSCKEIAERLSVSHRTVQTHRANATQKLGLRGSLALLQFAVSRRDLL